MRRLVLLIAALSAALCGACQSSAAAPQPIERPKINRIPRPTPAASPQELRDADVSEPAKDAKPKEIEPEKVDLRTASLSELCSLPGIGTARAKAIVDLRERRPIRSVRDLRRVHGIGPTTVRRLAPLVMVSKTRESEKSANQRR